MPIAMSTDSSKPRSDKLLVIIDMQKDFVSGSLGSAEAQAIVQQVQQTILDWDGLLAYTLDTHGNDYLSTSEGKALPVEHCVAGTEGHQLVEDLREPLKDAKVFEKPTFGSVALASWIAGLQALESVVLVGVCTDICVVSNALLIKAMRPELPVRVLSSHCAGSNKERHLAALETMKSCQIEVF
ncbi:Nicotinamidase/pyrazinamidase [bioreactor metagenome]|uniref:Nicotinamidase/pyrazinamidase n=1 Tax=bioreactor metagenome TaxID=1076179 RepID=A0A644YT48_9ZZZZ|nr:isochorismatase family cysteine hydrolase [Sphaerochaeta sp.]